MTSADTILLSVVVRTTHMWSPPTSLNGTASTYAYHFGVALPPRQNVHTAHWALMTFFSASAWSTLNLSAHVARCC